MTVIVNCPSLGITTRTGPSGLTGVTALRGRKVPYGHISNTFILPSWLGGNSKVDSIGQWGRGDLKARFVRDGGDALGRFSPIAKNIAAPSASPISLQVKESVGEAVYAWMQAMDLDVRTQSCGRVDDPVNWDMIKRLCGCLVTDMSTSGETSYAPSDEGETMIKVQLTSPNAPIIIYQIMGQITPLYDETRFSDYIYEPVVAPGPDCGYIISAVSGAIVSPNATLDLYSTPSDVKVLSLWNGASNDPPPTGWMAVGFDDSSWSASIESSGQHLVPPGNALALPVWSTGGVSIIEQNIFRQTFVLPVCVVTSAVLYFDNDDTLYGVWVNGYKLAEWLTPLPNDDHPMWALSIDPSMLVPGATNIITAWVGEAFVIEGGSACWNLVVDYVVSDTFMITYGTDVTGLVSGSDLLPYNPVSISAHDNIVVVVLSNGSVYWSGDYGKTFYASMGVAGAVVVEVWSHSNILVGCSGGIYSDGYVYQSTDGGRTFELVDPYNAVTGDVVDFAYRDGKVVFALDSNGMVSVSEDNGETFVRTSAVPISRPTSMVVLGDMIIVGGYASNVPVIVGSEDGGYTWYVLARIQGSDIVPSDFPTMRVRLAVEGCGVVVASIPYSNGGAVYSDIYRNVNWGAAGAWERIWQDSANAEAYNGFVVLTDITSACLNDLFAVGWIMGATPLYTGVKFSSGV